MESVMKRIALFLLTNLAVLVTLSVIAHLFGLSQIAGAQGLDFGALLAFAALFGFGGALVSLAISKWSAKLAVGARVIERPTNATEVWLVDTVARQAKAAGIGMPEVAVYESDEVNAFATGMNRNNALVAVSTGLLERMTRDEAEAVLGHEVSHIANGDMVTLALIQGIVNTFVIVIARGVGWFVDRVVLKNEEGPGIGYYVTFFVLEIALGILASGIVMWFSRRREFRADAGGAGLAGRNKMIAALERLQALQEASQLPERVAAFGISGGRKSGWARFFSTHPPLQERITALRASGARRPIAHRSVGA
jgi:heat shock protein HtpX